MKWLLYLAWSFVWIFIVNFLIYGKLIMPCISNPVAKLFILSSSTVILVVGYVFIAKMFKTGKKLYPTTYPDKNNKKALNTKDKDGNTPLTLSTNDVMPKTWLREKTTVEQAEREHLVSNKQFGPKPIPFGFINQRWEMFKAVAATR